MVLITLVATPRHAGWYELAGFAITIGSFIEIGLELSAPPAQIA